MKLTDVIKALSAVFSKPTADIKFKNLTEESLVSQINDTRMLLNTTKAAWNELTPKQLENLFEKANGQLKFNSEIVKSVGSPVSEFIQGMEVSLKGRARSMGLIKSIKHTSEIIDNLLDELEDNVDKIFINKKSVVVNDAQMSHGIFFGVLSASKMFAEFNGYLLASLGHIAFSKTGKVEVPKYILLYLVENGKNYIDLINQLCNATGKFSVINDITNIKNTGLDFKFAEMAHVQTRQIFSVLGIENIFLTIFSLLIRPIALIGEVYVDMRHLHYENIKEKKKWLESHVAIIKMEHEGLDSNDPKYLKVQKMIGYYEDKISEYDKKIQSYVD